MLIRVSGKLGELVLVIVVVVVVVGLFSFSSSFSSSGLLFTMIVVVSTGLRVLDAFGAGEVDVVDVGGLVVVVVVVCGGGAEVVVVVEVVVVGFAVVLVLVVVLGAKMNCDFKCQNQMSDKVGVEILVNIFMAIKCF